MSCVHKDRLTASATSRCSTISCHISTGRFVKHVDFWSANLESVATVLSVSTNGFASFPADGYDDGSSKEIRSGEGTDGDSTGCLALAIGFEDADCPIVSFLRFFFRWFMLVVCLDPIFMASFRRGLKGVKRDECRDCGAIF